MSENSNTAEKIIPVEPKAVACCVCLAEIPESVAKSSEGDEYTQHFCGIECYTKWRDENEKSK
jgi:Domain of unknown function (DUF3330)